MKKVLFLLLFPFVVHSATFQFNWGEGFDDDTAVTPVGGNTGTTLGEQRRILFQAVGDQWGLIIQSDVTIVVDATFIPMLCEATRAVLGSAGPTSFHSGFLSSPMPNTFYPRSLVDAIRGVNHNPGLADIATNFNSDIDTGCFNGGTFYYGINDDAPSNQVQLYSTILHELAHGLGYISLASYDDGSFPLVAGIPAIFDHHIFDTQFNLAWTAMTDAQRFTSMTNDPHLIWNGENVTNNAADFITQGFNSGKVRLHAPAKLAPGSSVSHFSTAASPSLLMEPSLSNLDYNQVDLTPYILQDIGYNLNGAAEIPIFINGFE
ncbi:MAG: hypothetical protein L3J53_06320 [Proteobacteria bacterium]|nr:hypothetical protein [Pseudomonadota bacterium]